MIISAFTLNYIDILLDDKPFDTVMMLEIILDLIVLITGFCRALLHSAKVLMKWFLLFNA